MHQKPNPRIAFTHRDFRYFQLSRMLGILGWQMQSVAVGWQIYELTRSPLYLGYIGLVTFLPNLAFMLVTGHVADRFDRRNIIRICQTVLVVCSLVLAWITLTGHAHVGWIFALMFCIGTARAFHAPASQAMLPLIVPPEHFPNAVVWNSSIWQFSTILGPALGGLLYARWGAGGVYLIDSVLIAGAILAVTLMRVRPGRLEANATSLATLLAGIRYVFEQKIVLGCISLDLFAVLLGGAVALLPVYAADILHVGPAGLGLMRGAPAVGALLMALAVAHLPPMKRAGITMLGGIFGFGLCTVVFGVSRNIYLSLVCLALLGALDMVSVIVRHTLVQTLTPKEMLGRVSAVNMVFIGASNELGEFESGVTAAWFGTVPAVVLGGVGTMIIVLLWALIFPAMLKIGRLDRVKRAE